MRFSFSFGGSCGKSGAGSVAVVVVVTVVVAGGAAVKNTGGGAVFASSGSARACDSSRSCSRRRLSVAPDDAGWRRREMTRMITERDVEEVIGSILSSSIPLAHLTVISPLRDDLDQPFD